MAYDLAKRTSDLRGRFRGLASTLPVDDRILAIVDTDGTGVVNSPWSTPANQIDSGPWSHPCSFNRDRICSTASTVASV